MFREVEPVRPEEAFADESEAAQLSQAAFLLAISLLITGDGERLDPDPEFELPSGDDLMAQGQVPYAQAVAELDVELETHIAEQLPELPRDLGPQLAKRAASADALAAKALIEASTHSEYPVVRASAAAAAISASGERDDLISILEKGVGSDDELARDISATALANVNQNHPRLQELVVEVEPSEGSQPPSNTAFLTHGTWKSNADWYQPGSSFHQYLVTDGHPWLPSIHNQSFRWSGGYRHDRRVLAAAQMVAWVQNQGLNTPDLLAHSHGGTVAHIATQVDLQLDRLVLLSWPVHRAWYPAFGNIGRIISFRVRFDLVIMVDRGCQRFRHPAVEEHVNGWFNHGATHDEDYWQKYDLLQHL